MASADLSRLVQKVAGYPPRGKPWRPPKAASTVEALSAKADVKRQAKEKVEQGKAQLRDQQARAKAKLDEVSEQAKSNPAPFAAAAGGAVALLLVVRRLRRRR